MTHSLEPPRLDLSRYAIPLQPFINGAFIDSLGQEKRKLVSSVNDAVITSDLQWSDIRDVDCAVDAAERGYQAWQAMSQESRRDALVKYGELIKKNRARMHWLEAVVTGKDAAFFNFEIDAAAALFTYYGNMIDKFPSKVLASTDREIRYTLHQPFGICAAILPFNAPLITFAMKVAPALACGNSLVIKTSEANPLSTLFLASLSTFAGLPRGLLNCLTGGPEVGHALASNMHIRKISFTGSVPVGRLVAVAAAQSNLKRVTLELGGKSPIVVFPDADIDRAINEGVAMFLALNGQGCALCTRAYVHRRVADEVIAKAKALAESHAATLGGDPLDGRTRSSPLYNHRQMEIVTSLIESGKQQATLLTGGLTKQTRGGHGCYVEPTIFLDPEPNARVLREEIFGPVLVICVFDTDEEVLALANDTEFGLAASVWTRDAGRAIRFSRQIEAGSVHINSMGGLSPAVPMGGWKQSGLGLENGEEAMLDWSQTKVVSMRP